MTGLLKPPRDSTFEELRFARETEAKSVCENPSGELFRISNTSKIGEEPSETIKLDELEDDDLQELSTIADQSLQAHERAVEETGAEVPIVRTFWRELHNHTRQEPGSVPSWAAGCAINRTIGPFIERESRAYWFKLFESVEKACHGGKALALS